jgi:hypothetical protein
MLHFAKKIKSYPMHSIEFESYSEAGCIVCLLERLLGGVRSLKGVGLENYMNLKEVNKLTWL